MIIRNLHFDNIKGDIYGGLTAAVVALPLALAMGVSSGAGPIAGLYGAICVGFFAAILGGTGAQISGPTGPMTVVMALIFSQYTTMFPDNHSYGVTIAFTVVILGGVFQILFGFLKVGKYINLMPYAVVSGFMSGIGVIIILLQLGPLLGVTSEPGTLKSLMALPNAIANISNIAITIGLITILIVYFLPKKIGKLIPSPLFALIAGTFGLVIYSGGEIDFSNNIANLSGARILGDIPTGLPNFNMPVMQVDLLVDMVKSALTLALLGSVDSLLTSLVADNITRTHHESNRELIGQGVGNTIAGFFGGLPGAGATMRTVVNVRAGGLTPISGVLHAVILFAIVLGAGAFAKFIPHAVLAGILIKVGTDIIDWSYIKNIHKSPIISTVIMLTVFIVTVLVDLIVAVTLGIILASLVFLQRMVKAQMENINIYTNQLEKAPLTKEAKAIMLKASGNILLFHLKGPLSFGAARYMEKRLATETSPYNVLLLDFIDVTNIDFTSAVSICEMINASKLNHRQVYIIGIDTKTAEVLSRRGISNNDVEFFDTRLVAVQTAANLLKL